jgi:low temperature requirement protein LtrA
VAAPNNDRVTEPTQVERVSTLELFFDLVFVFTITQFTALLANDVSWAAVGRIIVMLGAIWWMYSGYAWLTNAVAPNSTYRRFLLLVGMAGFLVIALAIPQAFAASAATGWAFGIGYFVVNAVHTTLFISVGGAKQAMRLIGPSNLLTASLILVGGFVPTPARIWLWTVAVFVQLISPYVRPLGGFQIGPAHFVERHGLVIIVALGESLVAVGVGLSLHLEIGLLVVAVLALTLSYFLWWAYFGGDEIRAEHAMEAIKDPRRRALAALNAFGYAHWPMLLGIIALSAGLKKLALHPFDALTLGQATTLGGGVALFLAGDIAFRVLLHIGRPWLRILSTAGALVTIPLGQVRGLAQLGALVAVMVVPLSVDGYRSFQRDRETLSTYRRG